MRRRIAMFGAVIGVICIWALSIARMGETHLAAAPWQLLAATSGAVVLLLTGATLLFRVARDHHVRSRAYANDVDQTRRLEVAVRLALASREAKPEVATAFAAMAVQLASPVAAAVEATGEMTSPLEQIRDIATIFKPSSGGAGAHE